MTLPHCFKFFLEDGKAVLYFRHWSSDAWCNADVAVKLLPASLHVYTNFFLSVIILNASQAHAYGNTVCARVYAVANNIAVFYRRQSSNIIIFYSSLGPDNTPIPFLNS